MHSIIPSNNSHLQHSLAKLSEHEIASLDARLIIQLHDTAQAPAAWLPYLAWQNSIADAEGWDFAETETARRAIIANWISLHQHKGTPSVIRQLFRDLQLGEVDIIERTADLHWNGQANFNGKHLFGGFAGDWAQYGIVLKRVISVKQAELIKQILHEITPARCQLLYLDFREAAIYWNGEIDFDGQYTFGAVS